VVARGAGVLLKIVQVGDPVLRQPARTLTADEILGRKIQQLIRDMREAMHDAPGVGLAAPQVGFSLQIAVIEDLEEYHKDVSAEALAERERRAVPFQVLINPVLTLVPMPETDNAVEFFEGCLSLAGFSALVPRVRSVRVQCLDERARPRVIEASGWHARILQHEVDHLRGALYIDHMRPRTFTSMDNWAQFWKGKRIGEIRSALGG
jgi:peptide deformylase